MILVAKVSTVWSRLLAIANADERTAETLRIQCRSITFSFFQSKHSLTHPRFCVKYFWLRWLGWQSKSQISRKHSKLRIWASSTVTEVALSLPSYRTPARFHEDLIAMLVVVISQDRKSRRIWSTSTTNESFLH
jgi:hypothetical protein